MISVNTKPDSIYYEWHPFSNVNLVNSENLPPTLQVYPYSIFPNYYHQQWTLFKSLPQTRNNIIFIGDSITDGGEWSELFNDIHIKNRGISGDISAGVAIPVAVGCMYFKIKRFISLRYKIPSHVSAQFRISQA